MKKEFWFEEMRLVIKRLKKGVPVGQFLEEARSLNLYLDNLLRIIVGGEGINIEEMTPPRPGFFRRFWLWVKSLRQVF